MCFVVALEQARETASEAITCSEVGQGLERGRRSERVRALDRLAAAVHFMDSAAVASEAEETLAAAVLEAGDGK